MNEGGGPAGEEELRGWMVRYQQGERDAFEALYGRTLPMIRGYLRSLVRDPTRCEDLVQESYLQIHRSRRTYDPRQPVRPWLLAIARHVRLSHERGFRRRATHEATGLDPLPDWPIPAEMEAYADRDELRRALAALPADRREALLLHHVYGLSYHEIGRVVGVSEGGARIRASRGMAELRQRLVPGGSDG